MSVQTRSWQLVLKPIFSDTESLAHSLKMKTINITRQTASLSKTLPVCKGLLAYTNRISTKVSLTKMCLKKINLRKDPHNVLFYHLPQFSFLEMLIPWNVFCLRHRTSSPSSGLGGTSPVGTYSCWLDYSADFHAIPGIGWQRCSSARRTRGPSRWDSGEYYPPWGDSWCVGHSWWG